ncbi:hypothetical protein Q4595_26325, partial [Wenyingzhuangia sp. 1_MG-2023]|nr:hypothetical protein [Wenyingzhuangia sp. 1_MG-2023]
CHTIASIVWQGLDARYAICQIFVSNRCLLLSWPVLFLEECFNVLNLFRIDTVNIKPLVSTVECKSTHTKADIL